jgi:hypothetical protein
VNNYELFLVDQLSEEEKTSTLISKINELAIGGKTTNWKQ